jgi:carboxylesterase type B
VAVVSDTRYACAARQTARAVLAGGRTPYRFRFLHSPEAPPYREYGAVHGLELMYLFATYAAHDYEVTLEERQMASEWRDFYRNVVHDGEPGVVGGRAWLPDRGSDDSVMRFGETRPQRESGRDEHCDFWERLALEGPVDG